MQHHEYVVYQTTPPQAMHTLQPHQPMTQPIQPVHHQPIPQSIPQSMNQSMPPPSNGEIMLPVKQMSQPYDPALHQQYHPIQQAAPSTMTCRCPNCQLLLSFPAGIPYISCPKCQVSFQPISAPYGAQPMMQQSISHPVQQPVSQPPSMTYTTCPQCSTLLSHPVTSTQIQCPHCRSILEVPHPTNQPNQPPGSPTPKNQSHHHRNKDPSNSSNNHSTPPQTRPSKEQDRERSSNNHRHNNTHPSSSSNEPIDPATGLPNKKRKDPNAPKRASNAYMIFCKERRAQLKNDRPDLPFGQLGKRLGEIWRSMSEKEKEVYELRACGDRDRYKGQMSEYQSFEMMKNVGAAPAKGQSNSEDKQSAPAKPQTQSTKRKRVSRPKKRPHSDEDSERSDFDDGSDRSDSDADQSNNNSNRRKRATHRSSSSQSSHQSS